MGLTPRKARTNHPEQQGLKLLHRNVSGRHVLRPNQSSRTTRIETWFICLLLHYRVARTNHPEQQGLKHQENGCHVRLGSARTNHPEQQGLKPLQEVKKHLGEQARTNHPEQQGLKLGFWCCSADRLRFARTNHPEQQGSKLEIHWPD